MKGKRQTTEDKIRILRAVEGTQRPCMTAPYEAPSVLLPCGCNSWVEINLRPT